MTHTVEFFDTRTFNDNTLSLVDANNVSVLGDRFLRCQFSSFIVKSKLAYFSISEPPYAHTQSLDHPPWRSNFSNGFPRFP